jgi:16S rRNA (guanine527-N7)-methyltransferase
MKEEFLQAVTANQERFGVSVGPTELEKFAAYYEFLLSRNEILHLVGPCSPSEFAVRHILESLFISDLLPKGGTVADVGSGGGLPGIPLAIVRSDLRAVLIESKARKATFLEEAAVVCGISDRVTVVNKQFQEANLPSDALVAVRALDKFSVRMVRLSKWAGKRKMILFGGPGLEEALVSGGRRFKRSLIPMSEQRYVFEIAGRSV